MSTQPTVTPTPKPPHKRSRIEQSKALGTIQPPRTPKPEPNDLMSKVIADKPTPTERSIEQTRADYVRRIRRQKELDTERIMGHFDACTGQDPIAVGRAENARKLLCYRLLSLGRLPSVVALECGFSFDEVIAMKRKYQL